MLCAGRRACAFEQRQLGDIHRSREVYLPRGTGEPPRAVDFERRLRASQCDVWPKRAPLQLETDSRCGDLEIVLEQFKPRFEFYPKPYDTCLPEVREGPDVRKAEREGTMRARNLIHGGCNGTDAIGFDVAEELHGDVTALRSCPFQFGSFTAKSDNRALCVIAHVGREFYGDEQASRCGHSWRTGPGEVALVGDVVAQLDGHVREPVLARERQRGSAHFEIGQCGHRAAIDDEDGQARTRLDPGGQPTLGEHPLQRRRAG
jgi:hypothetical protein